MYCTSCGTKNETGGTFCTSCGKPLNVQPVQQVVQKEKQGGLGKKEKAIILSLLGVVIVLLLIASIVLIKPLNGKRTIMIYLDGSNLESENGITTADLEAIIPSKIDFNKVNILVYTGGTEKWQNDYISNNENAIFQLTKDGYKKIKTYDKLNMGDPNTLSTFLKFGYDNFKASRYNLILYDHGGALDGAIYDDFTYDNLSLEDFSIALKNSPFNKRNKFDAVVFRTCLNGTLEVASIFKDYSNYIVFSEEISYGAPTSNVLSFINNVKPSDNGYEFGKKFVEQYKNQMSDIDMLGTMGVTYSVVDLSKIDGVIQELDNYITGIDLKKDYNNISRVRSNLYQYATAASESSYDTVDLYSLINQSNKFSSVNSSMLEKKINEAVIYNYTNMDNSHGLSIYFPYNGKSKIKIRFLNVYKKLDNFVGYKKFINDFYNLQNGSAALSLKISDSETKTEESGKEVSLQLTKEQMKSFASASYIVFERDKEHPNYYYPIYKSSYAKVDKNGLIKTDIGNNLISVVDEDGDSHIVPLFYTDVDGINNWYSGGVFLYDTSKSFDEKGFSYSVNLYYGYKKGKPYISNAKVVSDTDQRLEGTLLDIKKFDKMEIFTFEYKILDENGKYTADWEGAPEYKGFRIKLKDAKFSSSSLKDGEYYVAFNIYDINNKRHTSDLIKVGE